MCYSVGMADDNSPPPYRVIRVKFQRTARLAPLTDQARRSMAALWNDLVRLHKRIRRARWKWPSQGAFDAHFVKRKARYPGLPSACIQQAVRKFFGHLKTTRANRNNGAKARYPWRDQKRFATVPYRGDLVHWRHGRLTLGGGNGGPPIVIPLRHDPGPIRKAELRFDEVLVTVALHPGPPGAEPPPPPKRAAGDPGQRWAWTLLAEDGQSLMLHGRGLVSEKIRRAKKLGHLQAALAGKPRGSKRYRKIKRRIARLKAQSARRVRDLNHKVSRAVVRFGEQAGITQLVLSQPAGIAQAPGHKAQRQRNGFWDYGEQSRQIEYKAQGHLEVIRDGERGTSSTCPRCHQHHKPSGRMFRCPHCGWAGHRDLVGAGNQLGRHASHADVAALIEQTHPKYLRPFATAKARSSVVATDRSPARRKSPPAASARTGQREWPAGDHAGRATPAHRGRGRKARCPTGRGAGKNPGVRSGLPGTPAL